MARALGYASPSKMLGEMTPEEWATWNALEHVDPYLDSQWRHTDTSTREIVNQLSRLLIAWGAKPKDVPWAKPGQFVPKYRTGGRTRSKVSRREYWNRVQAFVSSTVQPRKR